MTEIEAGFPIKLVVPCEGTGYEIGSMSIIKGAKNLENAKKFYDWALTPAAQKIGGDLKNFQTPSNKATSGAAGRAQPRRDQAHQLRLREVRQRGGAQAHPGEVGQGGLLDPAELTGVSVDERYAFLRRLARDAGARARDFWLRRAALTVELKGPQDFVSVADREVEAFIRAEIGRAFPDDHFLGEETVASFTGDAERLWIVDPIDGTHNFLRGIPYWNVSIAYVEDGVRTLGAVYDPAHDELFHARRGAGAWCADPGGEARLDAATHDDCWPAR